MNKLGIFLNMIKFEHTVFALPFAFMGYLLGSRGNIYWPEVMWITLIMFSARTMGMCLNRLIDRDIDARNPRTKKRALVTGEISKPFVISSVLICLAVLAISVSQLNRLCILLLPIAVFVLMAYHFLKRFTAACHFGIGAVLACAPIGGWLVATGAWELGAVLLGLAIYT